MREIKFRAWDKTVKKMHEIKSLQWVIFDDKEIVTAYFKDDPKIEYMDFDTGNGMLLQFTGLKDRNGKEIYEGDICKWLDEIGQVFWSEENWCFCVGLPDTVWSWVHGRNNSKLEIIGNIYENPELLK